MVADAPFIPDRAIIEPMRPIASVLMTLALAGCIGFGGCRPSFPPLAIEQTGPLLVDPGGGPSVECRNLAATHCEVGFHVVDDPRPGFDVADIDRVVVSCVATCTARGGETRMDVVFRDGTSVVYANGGYGEFKQSCA
jgi:hypothetical protein